MKLSTWTDCYSGQWKGIIVDEAIVHPAKFARTLIGRIYRHLLDTGYVTPGATVVDPFGGVALGALDAMVNGLHWVGCELEPRFHVLGNANIAEWNRRYGHSEGWGSARLLNGDSRQLVEVVRPALADVVCSSPPYNAQTVHAAEGPKHEQNMRKAGYTEEYIKTKFRASKGPGGNTQMTDYGHSHGQLGSMPSGDVDAVLSSPPYNKPFSQDHPGTAGGTRGQTPSTPGAFTTYGTTPGQLEGLPMGNVADGIVSSPPFEASASTGVLSEAMRTEMRSRGHKPSASGESATYGSEPGNIGNNVGETFWAAARQIVAQCHAILKPGGVAVFVCKDFVRKGQRVPFSDDWRRLCEACGFVTVEWIKASLVKEWDEATLFNGTEKKRTERKSFFRRLAEKKGSPRIDHEDVLVMVKQ